MISAIAERSTPDPASEGAIPSVDLKLLRDAALRLDRMRREPGSPNTERALRLWEGLVRGRLTLVDWFDANGRRFILVKLNTTRPGCACRLTAREHQVAMGVALGESSKVISYRLELSPSRVSALVRGAMQKLGVRTKAQLVVMVRVLGTSIWMHGSPSRWQA